MVKESKTNMQEFGIYISGLTISQRALFLKKKDTSEPYVLVTAEIAIQPGVVEYTQYFPISDPAIKIEGEKVVQYPKLPELKPVTLKVEYYQADRGKFTIKRATVVNSSPHTNKPT